MRSIIMLIIPSFNFAPRYLSSRFASHPFRSTLNASSTPQSSNK